VVPRVKPGADRRWQPKPIRQAGGGCFQHWPVRHQGELRRSPKAAGTGLVNRSNEVTAECKCGGCQTGFKDGPWHIQAVGVGAVRSTKIHGHPP